MTLLLAVHRTWSHRVMVLMVVESVPELDVGHASYEMAVREHVEEAEDIHHGG